jgi:AcrR family transcriptional regulator
MQTTEPGDSSVARPRRDSEATRRRLLAAATAEFAERGIAGARVDRIASAARANKRLIYDYFGDKDGLFDAVVDAHIDRILDAVPIDASDLPAYAGRLFSYALDHPDLLRLVTWARLEGRLGPTARGKSTQSYHRRLAAIEAAQSKGHVTTRFTPAQILTLIESVSVGWIATTSAFLAAGEDGVARHRAAHREVVEEGVRRFLT